MKNIKPWSTISLVALFLLGDAARAAGNNNRVKPGEFIVDHPKLINLGFEWFIDGDDNRNAQVAVSYRKQEVSKVQKLYDAKDFDFSLKRCGGNRSRREPAQR